MDRRERFENLQIAMLAALDGRQTEIQTAMPGIIQSFDPISKTCSVQPALQARVTSPKDGSQSWVTLPLLVDCPVYFPSGGGYTLTFPLTKGDECLVVFSSRCIDAWWQSGGVQQQALMRMHDLSDGFVLAGISSVPSVQPNISTNSAQLRSNDGATYVELHSGTINIVTPTAVNINTPTATVNSQTATINASTTATVSSPSIILKNTGAALKKLVNDTMIALFNNHTHGGVATGGGTSGVPTSAMSSSNTTSVVQAE